MKIQINDIFYYTKLYFQSIISDLHYNIYNSHPSKGIH